MRPLPGLLALALIAALPGCALLVNKGYDDITLNSDPSGATCRVERNAQPVAQVKATPAVVRVPRSSHPIDIFCTKDGEAGARTVFPGVDLWTLRNLPMAVPYLVDSITDADRDLPEAILVRFPVKN
jgi:hypothetical protein